MDNQNNISIRLSKKSIIISVSVIVVVIIVGLVIYDLNKNTTFFESEKSDLNLSPVDQSSVGEKSSEQASDVKDNSKLFAKKKLEPKEKDSEVTEEVKVEAEAEKEQPIPPKETPAPTPTPEPESKPVSAPAPKDPYEGWQTYRNDAYKFTLRYPANFESHISGQEMFEFWPKGNNTIHTLIYCEVQGGDINSKSGALLDQLKSQTLVEDSIFTTQSFNARKIVHQYSDGDGSIAGTIYIDIGNGAVIAIIGEPVEQMTNIAKTAKRL